MKEDKDLKFEQAFPRTKYEDALPPSSDYMDTRHFTAIHHEVASQLGYKQTPGYATWDKVEETAPVQVVDRLVLYVQQERLRAKIEELRTIWPMFTDIQLNGTNGPEDNHLAREKIDNRIADLTKQLKEGKV